MAGLKHVGSESQGDITGKSKTFHVLASHSGVLGIGDLVVLTGTSFTDGYAEVDIGTANIGNTGVVTGVRPSFAGEALSYTHLPASTGGYLTVNTDAFALYAVDVANGPFTAVDVANGPFVAADVGLNCPAVVTAGTVSGSIFVSNMKANFTGRATTATLPLTVVRLLVGSDGVLGSRAMVRVNETNSKLGATGI